MTTFGLLAAATRIWRWPMADLVLTFSPHRRRRNLLPANSWSHPQASVILFNSWSCWNINLNYGKRKGYGVTFNMNKRDGQGLALMLLETQQSLPPVWDDLCYVNSKWAMWRKILLQRQNTILLEQLRVGDIAKLGGLATGELISKQGFGRLAFLVLQLKNY